MPSFDDEAVIALEIADRLRCRVVSVDTVQVAEENALQIGRCGQAVAWSAKLLARHRLDEVGRDDNDEFGFFLDVVAAAKERA